MPTGRYIWFVHFSQLEVQSNYIYTLINTQNTAFEKWKIKAIGFGKKTGHV